MVRTYENAQELKEEIGAAFRKYIAEFDDIPEALKDKRIRTKIRKWKRMAL